MTDDLSSIFDIEADRDLAARFSAIPRSPDESDWRDVLARTRTAKRSRRTPPRRVLLLAPLVAAVVVGPAVAVGNLWPFGAGTPAPAAAIEQFSELDTAAPPALAPHVSATDGRAFDAFQVAGSPVELWVAPAANSGFCAIIVGFLDGCRTDSVSRRVDYAMTGAPTDGRWVISGDIRTASGIDELMLEFRDGSAVSIPIVWISAPISAGFYLYEIPSEHWNNDASPTRLVGKDSGGNVISVQDLPASTTHILPTAR